MVGARHYNPATGQFLSCDPLQAVTGQPYAHANYNPLVYTDPTGLTGGVGTAICVSAMVAGLGMSYIDGAAEGDLDGFHRDAFLTAAFMVMAGCVRSDEVARQVMRAGAVSMDSLLNGLEAAGLDGRRL